jgi:hypothetical protein
MPVKGKMQENGFDDTEGMMSDLEKKWARISVVIFHDAKGYANGEA